MDHDDAELRSALLADVRAAQADLVEARRRFRQAIVACRQTRPPIPYWRITDQTRVSIATVRSLALQGDGYALRGRYHA